MRTSTVIKLSIATAGAGLIVLAAAESVAAATFYSITDLGNWSPTALNNWSQQIVGNSITADGNTHAVLWQNGTITDLGTLGSNYKNSRATDINDLGQVVGSSYNTVCSDPWSGGMNSGDSRGFLWQNGTMINLGTLDSNDSCSQAAAINNVGQVVGTSYATTLNYHRNYRAFLWENGKMIELANNPVGYNYGDSALGINDKGQVVGYTGHPQSGGSPAHATVWFNGGSIPLYGLPGPTIAHSINNAGQVVGESFSYPFIPYNPYHNGVLWENCSLPWLSQQCKAINLGMLPSDINDLGQVVGGVSLWENGVRSDLNSLLLNNSGWVLSNASAINNRGQIVGVGTFNGQSRGFLLTPSSQQYSVPEPSETFALLALGIFGATAMLKRQQQM